MEVRVSVGHGRVLKRAGTRIRRRKTPIGLEILICKRFPVVLYLLVSVHWFKH